MKCPYCGYEYDDSQLKCPFCGTENTEEARERQRETIWSLQEEGKHIRQNLPKQILQKANRTAVRIGMKSVIGILLGIVFAGVITATIRAVRTLDREHNLQQLETCLQEMDFDALVLYMDEIEEYDSYHYEKYYEVKYAFESLSYAQRALGWYYESLEDSYASEDTRTYYVGSAIADCLNALQDADTALSDQLIRDNEAALEEIRQETQNLLTALSLTEEEVQELLALNISYYVADDVQPYAELVRERIE